ncbi:K(+)/H(+) antiporter [Phlyctochytrium bullatum]|nr:K(+)/H(+) antiporter [Phlyctochytrium bullatum]
MAGGTSLSILTGENPNNISPISLFLVQAIIIIATSRILALGLVYVRQPRVIAEVIGGIILGASALSKIPSFKENIFPNSSLPGFKLVADFGLILYLFLIGLEMDPKSIVATVKKSIPVSLAGIVLPFVLGVGISKVIYENYSNQTVPFTSFMIFLVLARILTERKLLHTPVGSATISAAAVDDFVAWTLLILVMSIVNNASSSSAKPSDYAIAVYVFLIVIGYGALLWFAVRPGLLYLVRLSGRKESVSQFLLFIVFTLVLVSAWFTEVIGVHAIFGGFLMGVIMPHENGFARHLAEQIEDLVTIVFLPLYFAYSGLNTRIDTLNDGTAWGYVVLIILVACGGKIIGCTAASRMSGMNWRESFTVGILMNTKGLVEIIVLNLGLKSGVINEKIFSMFVVMAVTTTVMTVPIVSVIYPESYYLNVNDNSDPSPSSPRSNRSIDDNTSGTTLPEDEDKKSIAALRNASAASLTATDLSVLANRPTSADLRALVCLPSFGSVPPMMSITSAIGSSPYSLSVSGNPLTVSALRMMVLADRMSSVILAHEYADSLRSDPALSVFRTFTELHRLRSRTLLGTVLDSRPYGANILSAAKQTHSNLILLPWFPTDADHPVPDDFDASLAKQSYDEVYASPASRDLSIVVFIDRGFGRPAAAAGSAGPTIKKKKSGHGLNVKDWFPTSHAAAPASDTTPPTSPTVPVPSLLLHQDSTVSVQRGATVKGASVSALRSRTPVLLVVFFGGADDREALRLAALVAFGSQGTGGGLSRAMDMNPTARVVVLRMAFGKNSPANADAVAVAPTVAPTAGTRSGDLSWSAAAVDDVEALNLVRAAFRSHPTHLVIEDVDAFEPLDDPELNQRTVGSSFSSKLRPGASSAQAAVRPLGAVVADAADEACKRLAVAEDAAAGFGGTGLVGSDLVMVGKSSVGAAGRGGSAGMKTWVEAEVGASVAIVKAPGVGSGVGSEKMA